MNRPLLFFLVLSLSGVSLRAQEEKSVVPKETKMFGTIRLVEDPRISQILERQTALNERKGGIDGYRIQVFFNSGREAREEALRVKAEFLSDFSGIPVYIVYHSPFYKVRIGNYRTKYEALGVFQHIKRKYPSAYIVKDVIPFPDPEGAEK